MLYDFLRLPQQSWHGAAHVFCPGGGSLEILSLLLHFGASRLRLSLPNSVHQILATHHKSLDHLTEA